MCKACAIKGLKCCVLNAELQEVPTEIEFIH